MKYWTLVLLLLAGASNAALIKFESQGSLNSQVSGFPNVEIGNYTLTLTFNTETQTYQDGYFDSAILSGAAFANISPFEWDDYMMAHNISGSGIRIEGADKTYSIAIWEGWVFLPKNEPWHGRLDKTLFYGHLGSVGGYQNVQIHAETFEIVPPVSSEVPEPATIALLGLGLLGFARRRL